MTKNIYEIKNKYGKAYKVQIRHKGYKPVYKTFKDSDPKKALKEAKIWADDVELAMRKGTYKEFADNDYNIEFISELINYYDIEVARFKYAHYEKYKVMFEWWKNQIGHIRVKELTASQLTICKNILKNEKIKKKSGEVLRSPNTVNKYLMCLSAVLTYAVNELELIEINPMSKVALMDKPNGRTRFGSTEEMDALKNECKNYSDMIYLFYALLFKTGGRFNEVRHLQVKDIDKENNRVYFLDTKNHTHRSVYTGADVMKLLTDYMKNHNIESGYIFKSDRNGVELAYIKGAMEECIKNAGLKNFHIHDIRHTFASKMAEEGASLLEIAEVLGQKSLTVARLYSHLTRKQTEQLVASVMDKYEF